MNLNKKIKRILNDVGLNKKSETIKRCDFCKNKTVHYGDVCTSCLKVH